MPVLYLYTRIIPVYTVAQYTVTHLRPWPKQLTILTCLIYLTDDSVIHRLQYGKVYKLFFNLLLQKSKKMQDAELEYGQLGGVEVEESRPARRRWTRWAVVGVVVVAAVAVGCVFLLRRRPRPAKTKEEYCAAFTASSAPIRRPGRVLGWICSPRTTRIRLPGASSICGGLGLAHHWS